MSETTLRLVGALIAEHPSAAARRAERFSADEIAQLLCNLGIDLAVSLARALIPLSAAQVMVQLDEDRAAAILQRLGPQHAVVLLRRMSEVERARLLERIPAAPQRVMRRLLAYREDQAGSRMDPLAPVVAPDSTTESALEAVQAAADSALHYLYVVEADQRLVGVVSMRELMMAPPSEQVGRIMTPSPQRLSAEDPLKSVAVHPAWKRTHALPVVDGEGRFLGAMRYSAFRALETEIGRAKSGPQSGRTAEALAELLWIGTSAMGRMTGAALLGPGGDKERS